LGERVLSQERLERKALSYLQRFDASVGRLERVLKRFVRDHTPSEEQAATAELWIRELLLRYQASGVLDDHRYAQGLAESLRRRGASRRAMGAKLRAREVPVAIIDAVLAQSDAEDELRSAVVALKRRMRRGCPVDEDKALAALARAGFSYEVARRALVLARAAPG